MTETPRIVAHVLEHLHYIHFPQALSNADLTFLENKIPEWKSLPVEIHILDLKGLKHGHERFFRAIAGFTSELKPGQVVTLNLSEELTQEITHLKLQSAFNAGKMSEEPPKEIDPANLRRLLIRYLIRGAYSAIEVGLSSTVSCDENYLIALNKVPFNEFDLVSVIDVRGEFLNAQFRLCASRDVFHRLSTRMLGPKVKIDEEMIESMALELLNLIYGYAKSNLNDRESFRLPSAIPRLWRRSQFDQIQRSTSPAQISVLPLVTPMGSFYIEVDFGVGAV